jgi:LSD1 subclass zinc finger protein
MDRNHQGEFVMPANAICPSCGAEQSVPQGASEITCSFCATSFIPGNTQVFSQSEPDNTDSGVSLPIEAEAVPGDADEQTPDPIPAAGYASATRYDAPVVERIEVIPAGSTAVNQKHNLPAWIAIAVLAVLATCLVCGCLGLILLRTANSGQ